MNQSYSHESSHKALKVDRTPSGERAEIQREVFVMLRNAGLGVQVNYLPAYGHPVFKKDANFFGQHPNTETYYLEEISFP